MLPELRFALRLIRRSPIFVAAAVLTLAIGIGAVTAIFTVIDRVLLRPLDIHDATRVFTLRTADFRGAPAEGFLYRQVEAIRPTIASAMDAAIEYPEAVVISTPAGAVRAQAAFVSPNYFDVLGRLPIAGRTFVPLDDRSGAEPVAIIGHALWTTAFAARPDIVGSAVTISGVPMTVVGVAAPRQRGVDVQRVVDLFLPAHAVLRTTRNPGNSGNYYFQDGSPGYSPGNYWRLFGRLRGDGGAGAAAAAAACPPCSVQKLELIPVQTAAVAARVRGDVSRFSAVLLTAVSIVLLMACANLTGLILARTERRRREIGMRIALGASRGQLVAHLLVECGVIAALGCLAGLAAGQWIVAGLTTFELPGLIALERLDLSLNWRVLALAVAVSVGSALLVSVTPVRAALRTDVLSALKQIDPGARRGRARYALVAAHVTLSVVLVFGAGLFVRSLQTALAVDIGFDASRVLVANVDVAGARFDGARTARYFVDAVERLSTAPGVERVSYGSAAFFLGGSSTPRIVVDGADVRLPQNVMHLQGGPGYFQALGVRVIRGRDFLPTDTAGAPSVVVVNEGFARRFWPDGDALGHRISVPPVIIDATIVGVAEDGKYTRLDEAPRLAVFGAWHQVRVTDTPGLIIRVSSVTRSLSEVRRVVMALDPAVPVQYVRPLRENVERQVLPQRLGSWLLGSFGAVALALAIVGIYGLVAFLVAERTREIGIRLALGAQRRDIVSMIVSGVFAAVAIGAVAGTAAIWWLSTFLTRLLFGVAPRDLLALFVTLGVLMLAAAAGAAIPARQATRVDPMVALRVE